MIELKTIDYLTEEKRLEYNENLLEITDYIFKVARELKDEKVAIQISNLKQKLDREMAIVQNKNVKLENSNQYLRKELASAKAEKERNLTEKRRVEQQLQQVLNERDKARQEYQELLREMRKIEQANAAEIAKKKEEIISENAKIKDEEPAKQHKVEKNNASLIAVPETKKEETYNKVAIREQLTNYLMLFSPERRDRKLHNKVRNYFANPNVKMISVKGNKNEYTPNDYLSRLTVLGPYDIAIEDVTFDLQGKITKLEVAEVKLER